MLFKTMSRCSLVDDSILTSPQESMTQSDTSMIDKISSRLHTLHFVSNEMLSEESSQSEQGTGSKARSRSLKPSNNEGKAPCATSRGVGFLEKKYARKVYAITKFLLQFLRGTDMDLFEKCELRLNECYLKFNAGHGANGLASCIERSIRPIVGDQIWIWAYSQILRNKDLQCRHIHS